MKIKLTADTRVLLSAGTLVDVSPETAEIILGLGRCEIVEQAENKALSQAPSEAPKKSAPKKAAAKKTTKKK